MVSMGTTWSEFSSDLPLQVTLAGAGALVGVVLALAIQAHLWALGLAVPGLILERRLISARFAALYDRARMEGLYEVTLEANRGLQQQAVLDTILELGPAAAAQPGGHPDVRRPGGPTSWPRP